MTNYLKKTTINGVSSVCSCGGMRILQYSDASYVCTQCGLLQKVLIEISNKQINKDNQISNMNEINNSFSYKKINHFNETMNELQGKESTSIPQYVIDAIIAEAKKERIEDFSILTHEKIRSYLKKNSLVKWYEHISAIACRLGVKGIPQLTPEMEEVLRCMFKSTQIMFKK